VRSYVVHWLGQFLRADVAELLAPTWFTCIGIAGLAALLLMLVLGKRRGVDAGTVASILVWSYAAAVIAGIVMPMLIDSIEHLVTTGRVHLRWSGMTSFWGYLAGVGAAVLVCRRDGVPLGRVADLAVIPLGVALVCARLGCFVAGCDYGKVSSVPWAVRFPAGSPAWHDHVRAGLIPAGRAASLPVHPTQLYEALIGVAIVVIAVVFARRLRREGAVFLVAAATYALARLCIVEPLRGDAERGIYGGLSSGQIFSLLVLVAIAARLVVARRRAFVTAIAAAALVVCVADVGEVAAAPTATQATDVDTPPDVPPPSVEPAPIPPPPVPEPDQPRPMVMRPHFLVGALFGVATPLDRSSATVPSSMGESLSFGYTPGWFGVWLDYDRFTNREAVHTALIASVSFARRITPRFTLGARAGVGYTHVNFDAPTFSDVVGKTVRLEPTIEIAFARSWGLWIRPLTIDKLSAPELGGAITTYQCRIGFDYRFGFHRTRPAHPPPLPPLPPTYPTLDPDPPPPETAALDKATP
jgi:prolipoprotein diacylglyceryltransferase